jgi:ubiquinone/menaquinone biosynthesis C-methylase UbiE
MPELARHCDELYGIDIHPYQQSVTDILARFEVTAQLVSGTVEVLPFRENFFDCVVALSSLEFVENFQAACQEIKRVLKSDGCLVIVTPGASPIVDLGLKILTGENAKENYGDRRKFLIPTLKQFFTINKKLTFPSFGSWLVCLYRALKFFPLYNAAKNDTRK